MKSNNLCKEWMRHHAVYICIVILWLCTVSYGLKVIIAYENTPGEPSNPPAVWPQISKLKPASNSHTLIIMAHPRCPCTRATMEELDKLMAHVHQKIKAYVLFYRPQNSDADWNETDLWHKASRIPGIHVVNDAEGKEARIFRTPTSGATLLYSADGKLSFNGGITGSRGHAGDNEGRSALLNIILRDTAQYKETFVYGCPNLSKKNDKALSI